MRISELISLLDNRLREFRLSRDYARMNGDLERMNAADKEIIALGDTLYKLSLLVDTSESAAAKEATLTEIMTDGSIAVLGEYDITPYATDPQHEEKVMNILSNMEVMGTVEKIDDYVKSKYLSSPVTGEMVMSAALAYDVDVRLMMAIMEQDSRFGTVGLAVRTLNPGNVGNDDDGNTRTYESWQEGVTAVAEWLSRHRITEIIYEIPEETVDESTSTSTPDISTTTPDTSTSTPDTSTTTPPVDDTSTSTPPTDTSTTTPPVDDTSTSTPPTDTSTTTPPVDDTSTSTPPTDTSTTTPPVDDTSTSTPPTDTSTTTPETDTSTEETTPAATSTDSTSSPQASSGQTATTQETATSTAN